MAGSARLSDVARLAGVSIMSVSRALNGHPNVTEGMRLKVAAAAEQLRYQPNELARSLREQRSRQIGIIVPYLFDNFFAICAHAISTVARKHSYSVVLATSNEDAKTEFEEASRMLRRNVGGLIVIPAHAKGTRSLLLSEEFGRMPLVTLDRPINHGMSKRAQSREPVGPVDSVLVENERGARLGTCHLISLGHKRIAYIGLTNDLYTMEMRNRGYLAAMEDARLKPQCTVLTGGALSDSLQSLRKLLSARRPPTAIFCANNLITQHVLHSLHALGHHPPDPIALVGFDDFETADLLRPGVTVVRQPVDMLGRQAAQILFTRLAAKPGTYKSKDTVLPVELIIRGSCGATSD